MARLADHARRPMSLTAVIAALARHRRLFQPASPREHAVRPLAARSALFKDPNVFGPFLIWPALFAAHRMLTRHIGLIDLMVAGILLFGLLLSFSRGAWFHFAVSCVVLLGARLSDRADDRASACAFSRLARQRLALLGCWSSSCCRSIRSATCSTSARSSFSPTTSAKAAASGCRSWRCGSCCNFPNGMGPFEFARVNGLQQHNVYLQAFLVYGWIGGMAYIAAAALDAVGRPCAPCSCARHGSLI